MYETAHASRLSLCIVAGTMRKRTALEKLQAKVWAEALKIEMRIREARRLARRRKARLAKAAKRDGHGPGN